MNDLREIKDRLIELDRLQSRNSLDAFIEYTYQGYDAQWFHREVCYQLDRLLARDIKKLMIFMPPQHGKSEISSRRFPAYALGRDPSTKIALTSYSSSLARTFNRSIQMIMDDPLYHELFPNTNLNSSRVSTDTRNGVLRNSEIFEVVGYGGFVKTVGVGGGLTGTPVDIGIIDDPFKDRADANSEVMRDNVWNWYQDVFCTRLHNDSLQLMLFTRWHEDDLAGRILNPENKCYDEQEAKEWTVVAFGALKEETKPLPQALDIDDPREIDEALWESRHSADKYKKRRRNNPTGFASLDQQRPAPQEGNKIKKEWWTIKKEAELPFNIGSVVPDFWIDGAFTDKTENDESGLMASYFHKSDGNLYIFNCTGVRKELYEFLKFFPQYARSNNHHAKSNVWIELKASGHPIKSMMSKARFGGFNCRGIPSKVVGYGKFNRVENAEPFIASGKVILVEGSWNTRFIDQCAVFPNGSNDDMVDVMCYAVDHHFIRTSDREGTSYEE